MTSNFHQVIIRSQMYRLLSVLLDIPSKDALHELVNECDRLQSCLREGLAEPVKRALNDFLCAVKSESKNYSALEEYFQDILKEYSHLFHYSKPRLVPPYESVYREGRLFGVSTIEVKYLYTSAGLEFIDELNLPPDHIAYELEYMSYVCVQEELNRDNPDIAEKAKQLQREMLCKHLATFAQVLAKRLKMHAKLQYFIATSNLLETFIEQERRLFSC